MFGRICNSSALNIRILNPIIALQMLIFYAGGLQIHLNALYPDVVLLSLSAILVVGNVFGFPFILRLRLFCRVADDDGAKGNE